MSRAVWSGSLQVGMVVLPVKLHTAVREHKTKFGMLSPCHHSAVGYKYVCKTCQQEVQRSECKKGYWIDKERAVEIDQRELEALLPKSTKTIEVVGFVPKSEVDTFYYKTPFYVVPNDKNGGGVEKVYSLLVKALQLTDTVMIGKMVKNHHEHLITVGTRGNRLVLYLLWWKDEVLDPPEVPTTELKADEIELAKALVGKFTTTFDLSKFEDTYQSKVAELIQAKLLGKEIKVEQVAEQETDLMKALRVSVGV